MYKSIASYVSCRAGVYYYTRRVPFDVRQHYASNRLSFSLRTKSNAGALRAAQSVTQCLEDYWLGLRLQDMDIPAIHLVKANHVNDSSPLMSEAGKLRDVLLNRGLAVTSIKRIFGSIKAIINLSMAEYGIDDRNPFSSIYMPDEQPDERQPIPLSCIRQIQRDCAFHG